MPLGIMYLRLEREASAFISWSVEVDFSPHAAPDQPLGKLGKCLGPGAFGAFALENQNTPLLVFMLLGCSPCVEIVELFDYRV